MLRELSIAMGIIIELFTFLLIIVNMNNGLCTEESPCLWAFGFLFMILIGVIFIGFGLSEDVK